MPAFDIRKRTRTAIRNDQEFCENGCIARAGTGLRTDLGYRIATHVMTIHGHDFFLCQPCSTEAAKVWAEALEGSTGSEYHEAA
jgi:hypothetical protein